MNVAIFCSARWDFPENLQQELKSTCKALAQKHGLVYGGGREGLMGVMADIFLEEGAEVIGVMPKDLFSKEVNHTGVTEFIEAADLMERKRVMMDRSDAVLVLPGGVGTLDELLEVLTWKVLGCYDRPIYIYNVNDFWGRFMDLLEDLQEKKVLGAEVFNSFRVLSDFSQLKEELL